MTEAALDLFAREYARHRAQEGRGYRGHVLFDLPYVTKGPHARQWKVRARSFEAFMARIVQPRAQRSSVPLEVLDLGAGNGWLSHRIAGQGHHAIALDIRDDTVDGLGAAEPFLQRSRNLETIVGSFDAVPLPSASVDITVFNAALHYATDLTKVLCEAQRVTRPGGQIVIMDSPFYGREADGLAMTEEKRKAFGNKAAILMSLPFIEFLTPDRLHAAAPELEWKRHRVRYPLGYELRPVLAAVTGKRRPSRFDLWVASRP